MWSRCPAITKYDGSSVEDKIKKLLPDCSAMHFGSVKLSEKQHEFYRQFNDEHISLCNALPKSVQKEALRFLKNYSGIKRDEDSDFFKNYHAPSWSVIYWLTHSDHHNSNDLTAENIHDAISAHSMAMNLHSLDDHLNDGQISVNHLILLLRSQSWMIMSAAFNRLAAGVHDGEKIIQRFLDDYYSSICNPEEPESLDGYCDRFRKQMATWLIVPVLISKKLGFDENLTEAVQKAYESFGIAWRLLDDIQDMEKDMMGGEHSSIYISLTDKTKALWDKIPLEKSSNRNGYHKRILEHILSNGVVELVRKKAVSKLESAASIADGVKLTGLADEFRCLGKPLKNGRNHLVKDYIQEESCTDLSNKTLSIEVTTQCNSACSHCFVRAAMKKPASLPLNVVKDIIKEGHDLGYGNLHLTGGEPLLWGGLFEAIDSAVDLGYQSIFLNTNGTLLTEDIAGRLASYEGLKMSVSLEGREPLHDRVRGKGSYRLAVQGIERALDAGIELCIFTTVRKSLLSYLSYFVDEVCERFPSISHLTLIQLIRVKDDVFELSGELLDPNDFIKLVKIVSILSLFGRKIEILNNPLVNVTSKLLGIWGAPMSVPLHLDGDLIVMANCDTALAHSSHISFGKYAPETIKRVLLSDAYKISITLDKETCPSCNYSNLCIENGMVRPSQWYRDMHREVPYCKRVLDRTES
jgi:MoaA/NifB/PqqE/SkfB family radical SAM enzyme